MESPNTCSGNILVIDDEPFLVDLAKKFLEMNGFIVNGFCNALEAVNWFEEHYREIDLVIMDMKMPAMNGTLCFEKLCAINSSVRVVVLSGYLQDDSVHSLLQKGAVKFFQKPLKYPDLVKWISEYLGNTPQIAQH